jgi:hypothetical protein
VSPAGPEPMIATLIFFSSNFGRASLSQSADSAAKRFYSQMDTGSSASPRLQWVSHGWGQTLPRTPGRGIFSIIRPRAASYFPWPINRT